MEEGGVVVVGAVQARDKKAVAAPESSQAASPSRRAELIMVLELYELTVS